MKRCFHYKTYLLGFSLLFLFNFSLPLFSFAQPANNLCANAVLLTSGPTCVNTAGTLVAATYTAIPTIGCGVATRNDVWYKFVAQTPNPTITLSSTPANPQIQLFSGTCAALTSLACGTTSLTASGLTVGTTYLIRVYTSPNAAGTFNICITDPAPANDLCANAIALTSGPTCVNTAGTLVSATYTAIPSIGCGVASRNDVWYTFVAQSPNPTITLSSAPANPRVQLFSGSCGALTSLACGNTSLTASGLIINTTYYVRVYTDPNATGTFNICITDPAPANDACASAITLTSGISCVNTAGSLYASNLTAGVPGACGNASSADVWYKFTAQTAYPTITLSNIGASFNTAGTRIQLLSGACGAWASLACVSTTALSTATTPGGAGLTVGTVYYIRITSNTNTGVPAGGNDVWGFNICITDPSPGRVDFSSSYINVTKGTGGGTVAPGDTLEIRTTFAVFNGAMDSLAFYDTLVHAKGLRFVPNSLSIRTNEGKVYKSFTDVLDADAGWRAVTGSDTSIQINLGLNATGTVRGKLRNTSKPSFYGGTCIIMATYRVVVYASYNTKINYKGGAITYRDTATGVYTKYNFNRDTLMVYQSPGLCPNAISVTNAVGVETNGTFGAPSGAAPLARNRGTSAYTPAYTYQTFSSLGGPQDYYYGIANNTSARYTTLQNWGKPDTNSISYRVFTLWDIIGDHTGAANTAKGNPPCDTTKPVSPANPCGYMLIINSAYKTDTAFQYTVTNLCPNTYYEIAAWLRNICYKCGCDSNGVGATGAGYIPSGTGDSSGVQPNLAFQVNGIDYFTTGNIPYYGLTPTKSDTSNKWVKRGFTYLTGASQSTFLLTIRNNAPGGGGNDWALDDITVSTCLPTMKYSPGPIINVCKLNEQWIFDTVKSYFNNYIYYQWQRSTNGGATWSNATGSGNSGTGSPSWNGSAWQYVALYRIPPIDTWVTNNGDKYRLIVATLGGNLSNNNDCIFTDGGMVTISVIDCLWALNLQLLTFNGSTVNNHNNLFWITSKEGEAVQYLVEKSSDGINFTGIGTVNGYNNSAEKNQYSFVDPSLADNKYWYRIIIVNSKGEKKYSSIIHLGNEQGDFVLSNVVNPFKNELTFEIFTTKNEKIEASLIDMFEKTVRKSSYTLYSGVNVLNFYNTDNLSSGTYILRVGNNENSIYRRVIKN